MKRTVNHELAYNNWTECQESPDGLSHEFRSGSMGSEKSHSRIVADFAGSDSAIAIRNVLEHEWASEAHPNFA